MYQENRYWQSAVSWLNSGMPSFTKGSQWKKMVEETDFVLSFPHLEDEVNTTSRSPSAGKRRTHRGSVSTGPAAAGRFSCGGCEKLARADSQMQASSSEVPRVLSSTDPWHVSWSPRLPSVCRKAWNLPGERAGACPRLTTCSGAEAGRAGSAHLETETQVSARPPARPPSLCDGALTTPTPPRGTELPWLATTHAQRRQRWAGMWPTPPGENGGAPGSPTLPSVLLQSTPLRDVL